MTEKEFATELKKIGIELTEEMLEKFRTYAEYLLEYNTHTNLTAIRDVSDVYSKHFFDSILLAKYFNLEGLKVLDIGSGAGFPGVPLKICFPSINLTLLDSNGKKTAFLEKLRDVLNIEYTVVNDRAEKFVINERENFDLVTSRAVTAMPILAELSLPFVKVGGYFIPYKGNLDGTLEGGEFAICELGGAINDVKTDVIPKIEAKRTFVIVEKKCKTDGKYPRVFDKISKKPLQK